jgi:hypothetical protein
LPLRDVLIILRSFENEGKTKEFVIGDWRFVIGYLKNGQSQITNNQCFYSGRDSE